MQLAETGMVATVGDARRAHAMDGDRNFGRFPLGVIDMSVGLPSFLAAGVPIPGW